MLYIRLIIFSSPTLIEIQNVMQNYSLRANIHKKNIDCKNAYIQSVNHNRDISTAKINGFLHHKVVTFQNVHLMWGILDGEN